MCSRLTLLEVSIIEIIGEYTSTCRDSLYSVNGPLGSYLIFPFSRSVYYIYFLNSICAIYQFSVEKLWPSSRDTQQIQIKHIIELRVATINVLEKWVQSSK